MGLLDGLNKTLNTVGKVSSTTNRVMSEGANAKRTADNVGKVAGAVGKALAKKCKYCNSELKTDAEKQKGVCVNCALSRM